MKKRLAKTSVLIMCALLLLAAAVPVSASADGSASLTLKYVLPDIEFRVYLAATPSGSGYTPAAAYAGVSASFAPKTAQDWVTLTDALVAATASTAAPAASGKTDASGSLTFNGLAAGMYLVMGDSGSKNNVEYTPTPFVVTLTEGQALVCQVKHTETPVGPGNTTTVTVRKVWSRDKASVRPDAIVVQLLRDGEVYDTQVITAATSWRFTWVDLDADSTWTVNEDPVPPGYTVSISQRGRLFTITNTYKSPSDPPRTGDESNLGMWAAVMAASLVCAGAAVLVYKKRHTGND